jgi:hypothetical protein
VQTDEPNASAPGRSPARWIVAGVAATAVIVAGAVVVAQRGGDAAASSGPTTGSAPTVPVASASPSTSSPPASGTDAGARPASSPPAHTITVYGAAGSFRDLTPATATTSSGQDVAAQAVDGWGFDPGASAFYASVTTGGRVLFATVPQSDNQSEPLGMTMSIGVLDPDGSADVPGAPSGPTFNSLRIPTSTLGTAVVMPGHDVGGADVSDLCAVTTTAGPRTLGVSALPYKGWDFNVAGFWPAVVSFEDRPSQRGATAVTYDLATSRTTDQLRDDPAGKAAFPVHENSFGAYAETRGLGECDVTPGGFVIVSQYFFDEAAGEHSGSLVALTADGEVVAFQTLPEASLTAPMTLTRGDGSTVTVPAGTQLELSPREVRADPHTTARDDQRFVVLYDANVVDPERPDEHVVTPFSLQEFRFDATQGTIAPTSPPLLTDAAGDDDPSGAILRGNSTVYAPDGTLFLTRSTAVGPSSLLAAPVAVFRPGSLADRPGSPMPWGILTKPDAVLASTAGGANALTTVRSISFDAATSSVLMVGGVDARLRAFRWNGWAGDPTQAGTAAQPETPYCDVDLGGTLLANPTPGYRMQVRQGAIDAVRHVYYVPYQGLQPGAAASQKRNEMLPQYAFGVRLDSVLSPTNELGHC